MPVVGGTGTVPTLRVVHVAAEMAPIAKVGGAFWGDCLSLTSIRRAICTAPSHRALLPAPDMP